jgi:shikimate dehydrogenase
MNMRIPDSDTKIFGIIGKPVSHSLSPFLHNTLFQKYHYNGIYLRFPCDDLKRDLQDLVSLGVTGFSVTSPYKESIIPLLHSLDPLAKRIGAVNTVIRKNDTLIGYNTDWIGAVETLRPFHLRNKKALVLGFGGASRAVIHALTQLEIGSIVVLRRDVMDDRESFFENPLITLDAFTHFDRHDYDIIINGTPVSAPIDLRLLRPRKIAFDLRYGHSDFLFAAEKKDNTVVNGTTMFAGQAVEQFRLWTSVKPSITEALHALSLGLKRKQKNT